MKVDFQHYNSIIPAEQIRSIRDLPSDLKLFESGGIQCWYAPLGGTNHEAKIAFYGITPGWNQMKKAYNIFNHNKNCYTTNKRSLSEIAFAGSMRLNLVNMLDEIGLAEKLNVQSIESLFGSNTLAYSSIFKYPVFNGKKNYDGHSPNFNSSPNLIDILETVLKSELEKFNKTLIIPLGKSAFQGLQYVIAKFSFENIQLLEGFPHPSGANGHRKKQFTQNRKILIDQISEWEP